MDAAGLAQAQLVGYSGGELKDPSGVGDRSGMSFNVFNSGGGASGCGIRGMFDVSGPAPVTGSGTTGDPYETSLSHVCAPLNITQTFRYVNGDLAFVARYAVTNPTTEAVRFRAWLRSVFSAAGTTTGQGFLGSVSPRVIGVFNDAQGVEGGFAEVAASPWSRYVAGTAAYFNSFLDGGEEDVFGDGLDNTIDPEPVRDPRVAVEFAQYKTTGLAPGATATFEVIWFFGRYDGLSLSPITGGSTVGETRAVVATSLNHGQPVSGAAVRYAVTGANPSSGRVTTSASGTATISLTASAAGEDTLSAYLDVDDDGVFDADVDTQQTMRFSWTAAPPPAAAPSSASPTATPPQPGCALRGNVIVATAGPDTRTGTNATDIIFGLAGSDVLRGKGARDCLYGGANADRLAGDGGADRLFGGAGSDRLQGGAGNDRLRGEAGADRLRDASGTDVFSGGAGSDHIDARDTRAPRRTRADVVSCGPGRSDVARVDRRDRVNPDCERVIRRR